MSGSKTILELIIQDYKGKFKKVCDLQYRVGLTIFFRSIKMSDFDFFSGKIVPVLRIKVMVNILCYCCVKILQTLGL